MATKIYLWKSSAWQEVDETLIIDIQFEDKGDKALNKLTVSFDRSILDETYVPSYMTEIKLEIDGTAVFGGRIYQPVAEYPIYTVVAYTYGEDLLDKYVNEVYLAMSPEAIAQSIITNYTNLTYASTVTTGITIAKIVFKDKKVAECLETLAGILDFTFYTDSLKNAYFEPKGSTSAGKSLVVGTNVINQPSWNYNSTNIVTSLILEGDSQNFYKTDSFTATAGQTDFTLTYIPTGNIQVTVAGTVKSPEVTGSSSGDYTVTPDSKLIKLKTGATVGQAVVVTYTYAVKIKIEANQDVFDEYGTKIEKQEKIVNKSIQSFSEARKYSKVWLAAHSTPSKSTEMQVFGFDNAFEAGRKVPCIDDTETINEELLILETKWSYLDNIMTIKVGTIDYDFYDWQKEVMQKIKELEQQNSNESIVQLYDNLETKVKVSLLVTMDLYEIHPENTFIAGHVTLGRARASVLYEPDCAGYPTGLKNYGTFSGSGTHYITGGFRNWCAQFNGTDDKCTGATTVNGIRHIVMALKDYTNSRDVLKLTSSAKISLNSSGAVIATGLSNAVITEATVNGWKFVDITCDSINANSLIFGYSSSYYSGKADELMMFDSIITASDLTDIKNQAFDQTHSKYGNLLLWWAFDNPLAGDRKDYELVESQSGIN